jgi:type II secretory pathway pseudopilin PulG
MCDQTRQDISAAGRGDEGFMLLAAIVMIFMVLLVLSVAVPRMAKEIQRDREQESARRAGQYVRAIRIYNLKLKTFPTSIEQLEKTNNQRFLRQRYIDPLTGKDDWRMIHQGENKTTVKGFFGDDLPGLPPMTGGGIGSASGIQSSTGSTSAFNNSGIGGSQPGGTAAGGIGQSATGFGASTGTGTGTTGATGTGSSTSGSGVASQDATSFTGSAGPIIGVGSAKTGEAMLVVNEQTTYETWEFLYDPRIEQLYAKANIFGGGSSGTGTTGFGASAPGTNGTSFGTPIGGTPATPTSGTGTTTPASGTGATTPPTGP